MEQTTSEMSQNTVIPPRDLFSLLPSEIIAEIFRLAFIRTLVESMTNTYTKPPAGPINRALLPFDRHERFHLIHIRNYGELYRFAQIIKDDGVGEHVAEITLSGVEDLEAVLRREGRESFLASLTNLTHLRFEEACDTLQDLVLSPFAQTGLRKMTTLAVFEPQVGNPFNPRHLAHLADYPSLTFLSLNSWKPFKHLETHLNTFEISAKPVRPLSTLTKVTLSGAAVDSPTLIPPLLASVPSLDVPISLTEETGYPPLLPHLPPTLTHLGLCTPALFDNDLCNCDIDTLAHLTPSAPSTLAAALSPTTSSPTFTSSLILPPLVSAKVPSSTSTSSSPSLIPPPLTRPSPPSSSTLSPRGKGAASGTTAAGSSTTPILTRTWTQRGSPLCSDRRGG